MLPMPSVVPVWAHWRGGPRWEMVRKELLGLELGVNPGVWLPHVVLLPTGRQMAIIHGRRELTLPWPERGQG